MGHELESQNSVAAECDNTANNSGEDEEEKFAIEEENDSQSVSVEENNPQSVSVEENNHQNYHLGLPMVNNSDSLNSKSNEKKISFVTSNVGHPMLVVDMYTFHKHSTNPKTGRINWRCSKRRVKDIRCSSSCYTINGAVSDPTLHNSLCMPLTEDVLQNFQSKRSKRESFINTKADSYTTYHTRLNKSFSVSDLLTNRSSFVGTRNMIGSEETSQNSRSWNSRSWDYEDEAASNTKPISSHSGMNSRMYLAGPNKRKRYSPPRQKMEDIDNNNNDTNIKSEYVYNELEHDDNDLGYMDNNYEQNSESQLELDSTVEGASSENNNEYDEFEEEYDNSLRVENGCGDNNREKTFYEKFKNVKKELEKLKRSSSLDLQALKWKITMMEIDMTSLKSNLQQKNFENASLKKLVDEMIEQRVISSLKNT